MSDVVKLGIRVDASQLDRGKRSLREFNKEAKQTETGSVAAGKAIGRMAMQMAALALSAQSVNKTMQAMQTYQSMENSFRAMGQSVEQATASIRMLADTANDTRAPLQGTFDLYRRVMSAADDLGASQQQLAIFTSTVGKALSAGGVGAQQAEGALLQLSQAMAAGRVQAEEFNAILENAYPIAMAAAKGLEAAGGSVGKLRTLIKEGEVSSKQLFDAILSQADAIDKSFGETVPLVSQAFSVLGTNFVMFAGALEKATGLTTAFAEKIMVVADGLAWLTNYLETNHQMQSAFEQATDNSTIALGDQIRQLGQLQLAMGESHSMTIAIAEARLTEAESIRGVIAAEKELLVQKTLTAAGYSDVLAKIANTQAQMATITRSAGGIDAVGARAAESFAQLEATMVALIAEQQEMLAAARDMVKLTDEQEEALAASGAAAEVLRTAIENMKQGLVLVNGEWVEAATLTERADGATRSAAGAAALLAQNIGLAGAQARVLVANLGFVPTALAGLGESVAQQVESMKIANVSLTDQIKNGTSGTIAALKAERDAILNRMELEGANMTAQSESIELINDKIKTLEALDKENTALNKSLDALTAKTSASGGAAAKAAKEFKKLTEEITKMNLDADPVAKYNAEIAKLKDKLEHGLSDGAYADAVRDLNEQFLESSPILSGVNDALGQMVDYMFNGFKDGMAGIWQIFVDTLKRMAATALKNRITIGIGAAATGGTAAAAGGSGGGSLLSNLGGLWGSEAAPGLFGGSGLLGMGGGTGFLGLGAESGLATMLGGGTLGTIGSYAIPVLGVGLALAGLFKKTEVLVAEGVRARIDGALLELDSYEKTKTDNGFGMSSGFSRDFDRLDDAVQSAVGARLSATVDALGAFGLGTDLTGFSFSKRTEIKDGETFEGESEEVIREALSAAVEYLADGALDAFAKSGEALSDTLDRLTMSLDVVNPAIELLGSNTLQVSLAGADAASSLIDLSGGLDAFASKTSYVFEAFLTDQEKLDIATERLKQTFGELNTELPETHRQFRDLMEAQDIASEAGRQMYAALLDVAPLFVEVKGTAQDAASAIGDLVSSLSQAAQVRSGEVSAASRALEVQAMMDRALGVVARDADSALRDAENALRDAFRAEESRISDAYSLQIEAAQASADAASEQARAAAQTAQERVQLRQSIVDALERAYRDRRVLDALGERQALSEGTAFLRAAVAAGGTSDLDGLQAALSTVADPSKALFASFAEYQHDFNVNTSLIAKLKDQSEGQLSIELKTLNALNANIDAVSRAGSAQIRAIELARDSQLSAMDQQMNALLGIDTGVMSVAGAIANLKAAQSAASDAKAAVDANSGAATGSSSQFQPGSFGAQLDAIYWQELGRGVQQAGLDFYGGLYVNGFGLEDIRADIAQSPEAETYRATGVPRFAEGGQHRGGLARVGENDLELVAPSRIYSPRETREMLDNAPLAALIEELIDRTRDQQIEIKRMRTILKDWDLNGQPDFREGAGVLTE